MRSSDDKPVVVDLGHKETEAGWLRLLDKFYLAFTPLWFTWLGWVAALSGLEYISIKTGHSLAKVAWAVSQFLLFIYFIAFLCRFRFVGIPGVRSRRAIYVISVLISGVIAFILGLVSVRIAGVLAGQQ